MKSYIASFHTHFAALSTYKKLKAAGVECELSPVPRWMSSSCGTCVRYSSLDGSLSLLDEDFEQAVDVTDGRRDVIAKNR